MIDFIKKQGTRENTYVFELVKTILNQLPFFYFYPCNRYRSSY